MTEIQPEVEAEIELPQIRIYLDLKVDIVTITPDMARLWLDRNVKNRKKRRDGIEAYARDIRSGNWLVTGDSVKFDWFGNVIDGQHRLEAIVLANRAIQTVVVWGVDPKAQDRVDTGIIRQFRDQLALRNIKHSDIIAPMLRRVILWDEPYGERVQFNRNRVTAAELEAAFVKRQADVEECAAFVAPLSKDSGISASLLAFIFWILRQANDTEAREFIRKMSTGADIGEKDPIMILRKRIPKHKKDSRATIAQAQILWLAMFAWNAWMEEREVTRLLLPGMSNETFPRLRTTRRKPRATAVIETDEYEE